MIYLLNKEIESNTLIKKDEKYLLKHQGYSKDGAAKDGLSKCVENFSDFSNLENNGCYVHYQKKITQF